MSRWQRLMCCFGRHRLSVISRVGYGSEHIGCEACGRQWGMNHNVRAFLPWTADMADMYRRFGYDEDRALAEWRAGKRNRPLYYRDSDRSAEGGETRSGSTEGESAGREAASPETPSGDS